MAAAREQFKNDPAKLVDELTRLFEAGEAGKEKCYEWKVKIFALFA